MRKFIIILLVAIMNIIALGQAEQLSSSGDPADPSPTHRKPNYILIVADDLGYADLSINGSTQIQTPSIDLLAKRGVYFKEGYVTSAVCSPSRAGLMTGINQVEFGYDNNLIEVQPGFDKNYMGLPLSQKTIAERLQELGYVCGLVGKWHLGKEPQFHPLKRGFDEFWGYTGGGHDYFVSLPDGKGYKCAIECNYKDPAPISYITEDVGNECVSFIERHQDQPFFLFASFNAPHTPLQALEEDLKLYAHIKDKKRQTYAAMVHRLDVNIGKIVDAIENSGLMDETLIIFISDNGGPVDHNASLNAPYNGQKGILLEGGIHVPFIFCWPNSLPAGIQYQHPVSSLDILPTILESSRQIIEEEDCLDGVNLIPYILDKQKGLPHQELKWRFTISAAIRQGKWKLIRLPDRLPLLFDLSADTSEQNNISMKNIEKTEELLNILGNWDVDLPHPVFMENARWKRRQLGLYDKDYQLDQPMPE